MAVKFVSRRSLVTWMLLGVVWTVLVAVSVCVVTLGFRERMRLGGMSPRRRRSRIEPLP